jgi:hypothetical protein
MSESKNSYFASMGRTQVFIKREDPLPQDVTFSENVGEGSSLYKPHC